MSETPPRRRRLRVAFIVLAVVLLIPVAAAAALFATFDAEHYKPQIVAAIKRATGRDVTVNGTVRMLLNPGLTLEASDASLGNVPNGTRPEMATLQRIEAEVALWPLLQGQVEITRVVLIHPDILLETDAEGHPNWRFHRAGGEQSPALVATLAKHVHGSRLNVQSVRINDGTLTWRDGRTGTTRVVGLQRLDLAEGSDEAPIKVSGQVQYGGASVAVSGQLGPLARLRDAAATTPWPIQLSLATDNVRLTATGTFTDPRHGRGYTLKVEGNTPDLAQLAPLLPDVSVPPLHDLAFAVQVNDVGAAWPEPSAVVIHAGPSDLGTVVPGLTLTKLDISAPRFDQPVHLGIQGNYANTPLTLAASLGAPILLVPGLSNSSFPVDVTAEVAGASFAAKGGIAAPSQLTGLNVKITARIPELAALSPLLRRTLPPLRNIAFDGELVDRNASYLEGVVLKGIKLTMSEADLTGDAVLGLTSDRPTLHATLAASRIDLDGLSGAKAVPPSPAATPAAASTTAPAAPSAPPPAPRPRNSAGQAALLSDRKVPVDKLRQADADLRMTIGLLLSGGIEYRNVIAHLRLSNGHLRIDPLEGHVPGGPFDIHFDFNPNQPTTPISFAAHAPALALKPLLAVLRLPDDDAGALEIDADLHSSGDTPRAIAAGLNGHLGLALVNGAVDNRLLAYSLDELLHDAKLPAAIGGMTGHSDVRCFAVRADADHGIATLRAFMLDMTHVRVTGAGTINLADETLALRLRPLIKVAGSGVVIPVRVDGPILAPRTQSESSNATPETAGVATKFASRAGPLAPLLGALEGERLLRTSDTGDCDPALALARGERPASPPAPPKREKGLSGRDLLRGLLR